MIEICSICGKACPSPYLTEFDGQYLCPSCLDEETVACRQCGRRIWSKARDKDGKEVLCKICQGGVFTTCQMCGSPILWKATCYTEEDVLHERPICWVCFNKDGKF